jgi:hypothetical protein
MIPTPILRWLGAFLFTQAVEVPIYGYALKGRLHLAFLASLVTHPFVWFGFPYVARRLGTPYPVTVLIAEVFAITVEAVLLSRFGLRRALAWAAFANVASASLGLTSRYFFGWP